MNDKSAKSTETKPAKVEPAGDRVPAEVPFEDLQRMVLASVNETSVDPVEIEERIFRQMMEATSAEEVLSAGSVTAWSDKLDTPTYVQSVRFNRSSFGGDETLYAIVSARIDDKFTTLSIGARTPMQQLLVMQHKGFLPAWMQLQRSPRATEAGFYPLFLVPAEAPVPEEPF